MCLLVDSVRMSGGKNISNLSKEELEKYQHSPETELSLLVLKSSERKEFDELKAYLQVWQNQENKNPPYPTDRVFTGLWLTPWQNRCLVY